MVEFFTSVASFFEAIINFVMHMVQGLIYMITMIPQGMATITMAIGYLPAALLPFATAGIAICIVYLLIGR